MYTLQFQESVRYMLPSSLIAIPLGANRKFDGQRSEMLLTKSYVKPSSIAAFHLRISPFSGLSSTNR